MPQPVCAQWERSTLKLFDADMGSNPEIIFFNIYFFFTKREMAASEGDVEVKVNDGCIKLTDRSSYYIWQFFTVSNSSEVKKDGAKIAGCKFSDKIFGGCCTTRATATFWGVMYQGKLKLEYRHVLLSTKKMMIAERF